MPKKKKPKKEIPDRWRLTSREERKSGQWLTDDEIIKRGTRSGFYKSKQQVDRESFARGTVAGGARRTMTGGLRGAKASGTKVTSDRRKKKRRKR